MKEHTKSILQLQLAVMLFALSGVIGRTILSSAITIAFGRVLFSSLILLMVLKLKKKPLRANCPGDRLMTICAGLFLALHWTSFFASVKQGSVAIGTVTFSAYPLFLICILSLRSKKAPSLTDCVLCLLLLLGVTITVPFSNGNVEKLYAVVWGMVSALTYALLTLLNEELSKKYSGIWVSFREQSTAALFLLPIITLVRPNFEASDLPGIAAIGLLCTAAAFSLFVSAQKRVSSQTASLISGMETVYAIIFAFLFLGESPSIGEIAGGVIVISVNAAASMRASRSA